MTKQCLSVLVLVLTANQALAAGAVRGRSNIEHVRDLPGQGAFIHLVGQSLFLTPNRVMGKDKAEGKPMVPGTWFDVGADPAAPAVVNAALPSAWDVVVDGDYAFACDYQNFVTVYNIRDRQWREVAKLKMPSMAENLVLRGKRMYVANHTAGLTVVDISTPEKPVIVSNLNPQIDCDAIAIWNNTAILYGHWQSKLVLADLSDPAKPTVIGECQLPEKTFNQGELEVANGYAYGTTTKGIAVVNVTDPAAPELVATVDLGGATSDVILLDHYAFVAGRGVRVLDVQDPAKLIEVGSDPNPASGIAVRKVTGSTADYHIYTAGKSPAVLLFRVPAAKRGN